MKLRFVGLILLLAVTLAVYTPGVLSGFSTGLARVYAQDPPAEEVGESACRFIPKDSAQKGDCITCFNKGDVYTALGCLPGSTGGFIEYFIRFAIGIGGGIAFLLILFAGFQTMTSTGNPEKLHAAKELLGSAISGLLLIIFSVFLLRLIGVDILGIPGFSILPVERVYAQPLRIEDEGKTIVEISGPTGFRFSGKVGEVVGKAIPYVLTFAGVGLLLMIISSGLTLMTSVGDAKKMEAGKGRLTNAIVGFIVVFAAYWIVQLLGRMLGWSGIERTFSQ